MAFVRFACWRESELDTFVRTQALEGDQATFLAVHHPIQGFEMASGSLPEATDVRLRDALSGPVRHAVALVEGEPGSGKSHLIEWLRHAWPRNARDHVVLVPRSDGSLTGTLDRLRRRLGAEFAAPLEGLAQGNELTREGRAQLFLGHLVTACQAASFEATSARPRDADWLEHNEVWRILNANALRERWSAPRAIIDALLEPDGRSEQEVVRFRPTDLLELCELIRASSAKATVGSLRAQRFFVELQKELDTVRKVTATTADLDAQVSQLEAAAPKCRRLLLALDARIPRAVQGLVGIAAGELQKRFLDVRRLLRNADGPNGAGRRLVLLLEDITNLQGMDRQLVEALLPTPEISEDSDLCDLVAVVGLTPRYYQEFLEGMGNLRDRLRYHVRLSSTSQRGVASNVVYFLAQPNDRSVFVARYLNAIRSGHDRMAEWERAGDGDRPNACAHCPQRAVCHSAFGAVDVAGVDGGPVGLYPLTERALERLWDKLADPEGKRSLRTPRGILQNIISGALGSPRALEEGRFPTDEVTNRNIESISPGAEARRLLAKIESGERARLERAIVWWGDRDRGDKSDESYAGVPRNVMAAFALPWPGEGIVQPASATVVPSLPPRPPTPTPPGGQPRTPPPVAELPTDELPEIWRKHLTHLDAWMAGGGLREASAWEDALHKAVTALDPGPIGAPPWIWSQVLTRENVIFEGTAGRRTAMQFQLGRSDLVHRGLTAWAWLRFGTGLQEVTRAKHFVNYAAFQAWLARNLRTHVLQVREDLERRLGGDPARLLARVLVAGAWLEGQATPDSGPIEQWRAAFGSPNSAPLDRTQVWADLIQKFRDRRPTLVDLLPQVGRVGQKSQDGRLVDPGPCRAALSDVMSDAAWPETFGGALPASFQRLQLLVELVSTLRTAWEKAIFEEWNDLRERALEIDTVSAGKDVEPLLARAEEVLGRVARADRGLVESAFLGALGESLVSLRRGTGGRVRAVDDAVYNLMSDPSPASTAARLAVVLKVPRGDLCTVQNATERAEQAVASAHGRAKAWLAEGRGDEIDSNRAAAERLRAAAARFLAAGDDNA